MRGGERVLVAALAALERLHESFVFFTHKLILRGCVRENAAILCFHLAVLSRATATTVIRANKKPRLMIEKGRQSFCATSHFPRTHRVRAGIGTCIEIETSTGCRGVAGPVPSATLHETVGINGCGYIDLTDEGCQNFISSPPMTIRQVTGMTTTRCRKLRRLRHVHNILITFLTRTDEEDHLNEAHTLKGHGKRQVIIPIRWLT
jgi:hypothetical protein